MHSNVLQCLSPPLVNIWPSALALARTRGFGSDCAVFPAHMHCIGKISPAELVVTMSVNWRFSSFPKPSTCFAPCGAHVYLLSGIGFTPVWSPFRIASGGALAKVIANEARCAASLHWFSQSGGVFWAACVTVWWDHLNSSWRNRFTNELKHLNWGFLSISGANISRCPRIKAWAITFETGKPAALFANKSFLIRCITILWPAFTFN